MAVNTTVCNDETVSDEDHGWVQCRKANEGLHPVMIAGVYDRCLKGSRYDYLQTSSALLVTDAGRRYAGAFSKVANNVLCRAA